jgi:hypothetical protein
VVGTSSRTVHRGPYAEPIFRSCLWGASVVRLQTSSFGRSPNYSPDRATMYWQYAGQVAAPAIRIDRLKLILASDRQIPPLRALSGTARACRSPGEPGVVICAQLTNNLETGLRGGRPTQPALPRPATHWRYADRHDRRHPQLTRTEPFRRRGGGTAG